MIVILSIFYYTRYQERALKDFFGNWYDEVYSILFKLCGGF